MQEVEKFNSLEKEWWNLNGKLSTLHQLNQLRVPYIKNWIKKNEATILDVGCGGGILSEGLYDAGFSNITGIDLGISSIKVATEHAKKGKKNITYKNIDICDLDSQFDVIICSEVLEHVDDLSNMLSNIYNKTKNGGLIICSTINKTWQAWLEAILAPEYIFNLVDKGTHDFDKLVKPSHITNGLPQAKILNIRGISYSLIDKKFYFRENINANYIIILQKI